MHTVLKFVGAAVVASGLAVFLTLFAFGMSRAAAVRTGLIAGAVALVIGYLTTRQSNSTA